jgi:hypothetical protein
MYRQTSEKRKHEPNDAGFGHEEDAIREGRRAVELLPLSKDSLNGANHDQIPWRDVPHTCLSTYGGSRMLSTAIAMTVIGLKGGRIYFKAHAATEATVANRLVHLT